ncbi:MAG: hypothetical protein M0R40_07890 [Firmicutes bacterium]|nr:hypothetical protein [Bacillota bacterium]
MYKRYYSPFEEQPITKSYQAETIKPKKIENIDEKQDGYNAPSQKNNLLGSLSFDDAILIIILLILLTDDKENKDMPLILAISFLLLNSRQSG